MASGCMGLNKAMVCGRGPTGNLTLVNGRAARLMDMGCMFGSTETDMRESGSHALDTEMAQISSRTVTCILANTHTVNLRATVSINGSMATLTKVPSKMGLSTETESGRKKLKLRVVVPTTMREITIWIRKTAGATSNGRAATPTEAAMLTTRERDSVK